MKKLTIAISNYNYEAYLAESIDSALNQHYLNTEIIVVDDGSADNSRQIIESYGDKVKAVFQANGGQNAALNTAFQCASGDVVIFLDADDRLMPDIGALVMAEFAANPALSRVQWPLHVVDADGHPTGLTNPNPDSMASGNLAQHIVNYRTHVWPPQSGNAYSMDALQRVLPIPVEFPLNCDLYLAETTALLGEIKSLSAAGGDYRIHGNNNWSASRLDVSNLRRRIELTELNHIQVRKVCASQGIPCPEDVTDALDVAFICQRLASLRMEPSMHPIADDRRLALLSHGLKAAALHPHHSFKHKTKRMLWLLGVGLGPKKVAAHLIERFYFRK